MAAPFHVPDELLQGFFKAGQTWVQALAAAPGTQPADAAAQPGAEWAQAQAAWWQQQMDLWAATVGGQAQEAGLAPEPTDRRFSAEAWRSSPWHRLLQQNYLLNARLIADTVEAADLGDKEKHKLRFFARLFIDAMSPANFAVTNPEVQKLALESQGESLKAGWANLIEDLRKGRLSITDETAFDVGTDVAASKGSVVFENALMQLIQYAPLTDTVAARPLLIVPPCINKFYILDLQPDNSFVRFACEQGMTVFVVSWCNPDAALGGTTWDDYLEQGAMAAIEVALAISGADKVNALGWCVGGTILSSALAVMRARAEDSVASLTLLTTLLDFHDPGDLGVFIDEQGVARRERSLGAGGIYPGAELGTVFQTLRANDLIWPNVINNYLKGKSPQAFDLLYWNADGTNLPGPMYAWYLRNMYLENRLCVPKQLTMCGVQVDLGDIDMPSYVLATQEDHIVPWKSAYRTVRLLGGESQFVLGASGHIAGVINPASKNKRQHWVGGQQGEDPQAWLSTAQAVPGSWWTHWMAWLKPLAGKPVAARKRLGNTRHKPIEAAPGRYVKVRAQ